MHPSKPEVVPSSDAPDPPSAKRVPQVRLVFMGTPSFAAAHLGALMTEGYNIVAVYTRADTLKDGSDRSGRSQKLVSNPVKALAAQHGLPLEQPERFDEASVARLKAYQPDIIVVAAYGKILPPEVLGLPGFGCINIHGSLLPRWRGASPVQNALLSGDAETGITLMLMSEGVDEGPTLAARELPIGAHDTTATLLERLSVLGTHLLLETLPAWIERAIEPVTQDETQAVLCQLIEREDGRVFWTEEAEVIERKARAFTPWPGVFTFWKHGERLWRIKLTNVSYQKIDPQEKKRLGEVSELGEKIGVQTGAGVLFLETLQQEGKVPLPIREFLKGYPDFLGSVLE